jgi:hypothetical protein
VRWKGCGSIFYISVFLFSSSNAVGYACECNVAAFNTLYCGLTHLGDVALG